MPISIEADPTLAQGYIKVNGTTAATVTSTGLTTASLQNAAVTPAKLAQPYTLATAQASTSGTAIDFTGIPSWVRRITVMFNGVSTNGTSGLSIQLGTSGGIVSSGYSGGVSVQTQFDASSSTFFVYNSASAADVVSGNVVITTLGSNVWTEIGNLAQAANGACRSSAGSVTLSSALTQVRIVTANSTDTFDAGTINIAYEG